MSPYKSAICAVLVLMTSLVAATAQAAPILTFASWDSSQTSLFVQGAGKTTWEGNNLIAEYRQEYGSKAWAQTSATTTDGGNRLPSPNNAVGIAFNVSASYYPTSWTVALDLGCGGCGFSSSVQPASGFGRPDPSIFDGGGGDPKYIKSSYFPQEPPVEYTYSNGLWSVQMFFPDEWLFNRDDLEERFIFFASNTQGGVSQLVDGITRFDNVRWILNDPFPTAPPPPPDGTVPEPASLALLGLGLVGLGFIRRKVIKR